MVVWPRSHRRPMSITDFTDFAGTKASANAAEADNNATRARALMALQEGGFPPVHEHVCRRRVAQPVSNTLTATRAQKSGVAARREELAREMRNLHRVCGDNLLTYPGTAGPTTMFMLRILVEADRAQVCNRGRRLGVFLVRTSGLCVT